MISVLTLPGRAVLIGEFALLFILTPVLIALHPTKWNVHLGMWCVATYASFILSRQPGFSWRDAWRGQGELWTRRDTILVTARFLVSALGIYFLTLLMEPDRLFAFPVGRPVFWLVVMLLYPLLSALPQEIVFRSFFFRRYGALFPANGIMLAVSAFVFGFVHIVFHNPVSPFLSLICGFFLASSYLRHASLKKAALEHALYGDMVFTIGLGLYFLVGTYK